MRTFTNADALAVALAEATAQALAADIASRGAAVLAVSGGSTPALFFKKLSTQPLDWSKVTIIPVDERWVAEDHPRSNGTMARRLLHKNQAAAARFLPLYNGADTPQDARAALERDIAALPRPFSAVILGMGSDGHTASWFPGGDRLAQALQPVDGRLVETMQAPAAGEPRITLTLPPVLDSPFLALHIEGEQKQAVLAKAQQPGPVEEMPIRAVLGAPGLQIFWSP